MASELAEKISAAVLEGMKYYGSTNPPYDIPQVVDQVISENGVNTCVYCGEVSFKGFIHENGQWTSLAKDAMADHVMNCSKRPEAKLIDVLIDAKKYAQIALVSLNAKDLTTTQNTITDLIKVLTPPLKPPEAGSGDNND